MSFYVNTINGQKYPRSPKSASYSVAETGITELVMAYTHLCDIHMILLNLRNYSFL